MADDERVRALEDALDRLVEWVDRIHVHLPNALMKADAMHECAEAAAVYWSSKKFTAVKEGEKESRNA